MAYYSVWKKTDVISKFITISRDINLLMAVVNHDIFFSTKVVVVLKDEGWWMEDHSSDYLRNGAVEERQGSRDYDNSPVEEEEEEWGRRLSAGME